MPICTRRAGKRCNRRIVGDHDDGVARLVQLPEQRQDLRTRGGIQNPCRFVRQQQRRRSDQSPRYGHPLLLAARKLAGLMADAVFKPHLPDALHRQPLGAVSRNPPDEQGQNHILQHGVLGNEMVFLENKAEVLLPASGQTGRKRPHVRFSPLSSPIFFAFLTKNAR